jgi:CheY-like chemotaxis protein
VDDPLTETIIVVGDDLIWSTRLAAAVRRAGALPVVLASEAELAIALEAQDLGDRPSLSGAVVDMGARRLDAVAAIEQVAAARLPVIAVAQHDDQVTRKRASLAGASRVFAYNKFFTDGTLLVERWLAASAVDSAHERPDIATAPSDVGTARSARRA